MAGSAPATPVKRQSVSAHHRSGMRPNALQSLPTPRRAAPAFCLLALSALLVDASTQKYVVCKVPKSFKCLIWLIDLENYVDITNELDPSTEIAKNCYFSDLKPSLRSSKTIMVEPIISGGPRRHLICRSKKMLDVSGTEWSSVEKAFDGASRARRSANYSPRGRYRGQTQSQYLAIDRGSGKDEGKAEAHSAADSSRATVIGNSGMGQAQSQSIYDPSCDECVSNTNGEAASLQRPAEMASQGSAAPRGNSFGNTGSRPEGYAGINSYEGNGNSEYGHDPNKQRSRTPNNDFNKNFGLTDPNGGLGTVTNPNGRLGSLPNPNGGLESANGPIGGLSPTNGQNGGLISTYGPNGGLVTAQGNLPGINSNGGYGSIGPPRFDYKGNGMSNGQQPYGMNGMGTNGIGSHNGLGPNGMMSGHGDIRPNGMLNGYGEVGPNGVPNSSIGLGSNGILNGHGAVSPNGVSNSNSGLEPNSILSGYGKVGPNGMPISNGIIGSHISGVPSVGGGLSGYGSNHVTGGSYPSGSSSTPSGNGNQIVLGHNGIPNSVGFRTNGMPDSVSMQQGRNIGPISNQNIPGDSIPRANGALVPEKNGQSGTFPGRKVWPSTNSFTGPDGVTYYCCVAGPNNVPQHFKYNGGGVPETIGVGQYGPGYGLPSSPGNSGQGSTGHYVPGTGVQESGSPYNSGAADQGSAGPYLTGTGVGTVQGTGRPFSLGINQGATGPYMPSNQGSTRPYTTGGPSDQILNGLYTPGIRNGHGMSGSYPLELGGSQGGAYTPGVGSDLKTTRPVNGDLGPAAQYMPARGTQGMDGRYPTGVRTGNGQGSSGPYDTGVGRDQLPNGPYTPIGFDEGSGGPYNVGSGLGPAYGSGSSRPNGLYGTGARPGSIGSYGPDGGQGSTGFPSQSNQRPVGPYPSNVQGPTGSYSPGELRSTEHYVPMGGQQSTGPYGQGSTGPYDQGNQGSKGPYSQGGQGPIGQYGSGADNGPYKIGGRDPGSFTPGFADHQGASEPYVPSSGSGSGPYVLGGAGGTYTPGIGGPGSSGTYTPGLGAGQSPGGSYIPGSGRQDTTGRYTPGTNGPPSSGLYPSGVGGNQGVREGVPPYSPRVESGQDLAGPGMTGQGSSGQYGPRIGDGTSGLYTPGVGGGQGQSGPYSPGAGAIGQYNPEKDGIGYGRSYAPGTGGGENIGRPYGSNKGPGSGGQYGPYGYDNQMGPNSQNGLPQNVIDPTSITDGDDSQAEAIVSQAANGTTASASSRGGNDKGRAQTNVHGTYTGSGSFAAQAEISGENKAANSEVAGDKKGASSTAQGSGRNNKSQANVKLGSETGAVLTGSQSEGIMHSSNTQVQGSVKGGMADAQSRGPGSTSSQAQIGFTPYKNGDKSHDLQKTPFMGGGIASAQSSGRIGKSQSQLHGTFKYGITYNGAAQAGASLDKDAVFPNKLPFDKIDVFDENNTNINMDANNESTPLPHINITPDSELDLTTYIPFEPELATDKNKEDSKKNSDNVYSGHTHDDHHKTNVSLSAPTVAPPVESRRSFQPTYSTNSGDYEYATDKDYNNNNPSDDYDVDDGFVPEENEPIDPDQNYVNTNYNEFSKPQEATHQSLHSPKRKGIEVRQTTSGNTQHIVLGSLDDQDAEITQKNSERPDESRVYQPGEQVPGTGGYTIPIGFTGSVKSVASKEKTYVVGSKESPSQAQTVSLSPGSGKVTYKHPARARNVSPKNLRSLYQPNSDDNNRYVSVSKSVTRDLDGENNIRKQYSHTYYTKSSSCGYFTFTCTMVSSSEGKKKVCRPKIPTNPDGTPMRC